MRSRSVPVVAFSDWQEPVACAAERGTAAVGTKKHRQNERCGFRCRENAVSQRGSVGAGTGLAASGLTRRNSGLRPLVAEVIGRLKWKAAVMKFLP